MVAAFVRAAEGSALAALVQLVDYIPAPLPPRRRRGRPAVYPDRLFLKALVIMIVRHLAQVHTLLAVELLVPPGGGPSFATSQDVNMLVNALGGRERTVAEYRAAYAAAGFDLTRTIPAQGELHIIEGVPV